MSDVGQPIVPASEIDLGSFTLPLWIVPFDAAGECTGPRTRTAIVDELAGAGYTDVFLFAHGWNNTYSEAKSKYSDFITGYHDLVEKLGLTHPAPYRPLTIGVQWPSISLLLPSERAPKMAATGGSDPLTEAMIGLAQESLGADEARRLRVLSESHELTEPQAAEFASLLAGSYPDDDELQPAKPETDAAEVLHIWSEVRDGASDGAGEESEGPGQFGRVAVDTPAADPELAGLSLGRFDPREILRAFTVYKMKDRAGVVGARGVGPLVRDVLSADDDVRLHLIGHSYGCRVLLAALCAQPLPRRAESLLLLEPAVNYLCFAEQVPLSGQPGGFRTALSRVKQPVFSTFSERDRALHDYFHLALRRDADLGEAKMAALGTVPSLYCALGGWGPGGLGADEALEVALKRAPERYDTGGAQQSIFALNGKIGITGHSDVINEWTFWALYNQVAD